MAVPRFALDELPPAEFETRFMAANQPCVLTGVGREWRACREWADQQTGGARLEALRARFGDEAVSVHDCAASVAGRARISEMRLGDVLDGWEAGQFASLYVKDWNLALNDPAVAHYETPPHFAADWLNAHAHETGQASDHRFVYVGRAGTFTPLHKDVLCSYSWSFNVAGEKRWWLVAPEDEWRLRRDDGTGALARDLRAVSPVDHPAWDAAAQARVLQVRQRPGEAIFIPSEWVHQVLNESDVVISINHNWLNRHNARRCWRFLRSQLEEIRRTVEGCADDEETAQEILEFKFTFNYASWHELLRVALAASVARAEALRRASDPVCDGGAPPTPDAPGLLRSALDDVAVALELLQLVSETEALRSLADGADDGSARRADCEELAERARELLRRMGRSPPDSGALTADP